MLVSCFTCVLWSALSPPSATKRDSHTHRQVRPHEHIVLYHADYSTINDLATLCQSMRGVVPLHVDRRAHTKTVHMHARRRLATQKERAVHSRRVGWRPRAGKSVVYPPLSRHIISSLPCTADIVADTILVALPIRLLWDINISSPNRKLLMAIFSASMVTTIVSIVHTAFELSTNRNAEAIAAHVEVGLPIIYPLLILTHTHSPPFLSSSAISLCSSPGSCASCGTARTSSRAGGPTQRRAARRDAAPRSRPSASATTPRSS